MPLRVNFVIMPYTHYSFNKQGLDYVAWSLCISDFFELFLNYLVRTLLIMMLSIINSNMDLFQVTNINFCKFTELNFLLGLPVTELLLGDYSCALQKEILVHGRMYVTTNFLCFYANLWKWETAVTVKWKVFEFAFLISSI